MKSDCYKNQQSITVGGTKLASESVVANISSEGNWDTSWTSLVS